MTTTTEVSTRDAQQRQILTPVGPIQLTVSGSLDRDTRETIDRLSSALRAPKCDAIGECGAKCSLRSGHPGEIHEEFQYGRTTRFRLTGQALARP